MLKNVKFSSAISARLWSMLVLVGMVLLSTACGNSSAGSSSANSSSNNIDSCTWLSKDDISNALGVTTASVMSQSAGNTCTYTTTTLSVQLTVEQTGGKKYMKDTLAQIGGFAVTVQGLGDQAFYNIDAPVNSLAVLKGDSVYSFVAKDSSQQLAAADLRMVERAVADQLISHLH